MIAAPSNPYDTLANPISPPTAEKPKRRWIRPVLIGSGMLIAFLLGIGVGGTNANLAATESADTNAGLRTDLARAEQQRDQANAELTDTKAAASTMQDELDALQAQEADLAAREDDVAARESELDQREADLDAQEAALAEQGQAVEPAPPAEPVPLAEPAGECHPSYEPCVPIASDVDCEGGSGNGPAYTGTVRVIGPDEYDLDRDGDGVGCEQS
jgi:hypothetical protein